MSEEIPFGKIKEGKIILNAWGDLPDRQIGEIKDEDVNASTNYFVQRFEELEKKISNLEKEIEESQNKGSFLMKLIHLKEQLDTHDGLGDYQDLLERLERQESLLKDFIEKNREKNSEIKKALLAEVKAAADKINWKEATVEIHDIKERWIKTGNAKEEDQKILDEEFWGVLEQFFEKKKQFYEDKKLLGEKRKRDYEALIAKAGALENLHGKERFDTVKSLKEEWKAIGNIPKEEYTELLHAFNKKLKGNKKPPIRLNLKEVLTELDEVIAGKRPYSYKAIESYKKTLQFFRPQEKGDRDAKKEAFRKIQLLTERDFLDKLAMKRFKNFRELEKPKKKSIRIGILEELIGRDKADLAKYQENSTKFSSHGGSMIDIVEKKLAQQKNKIATKEALLSMLKEEK